MVKRSKTRSSLKKKSNISTTNKSFEKFEKIYNFIEENHIKIIIILLLIAFILRFFFFLEIYNSSFKNYLTVDPEYHHKLAKQFSEGNWKYEGVFFRAPLYYYLLGIFYTVSDNSQNFAKIIQIIISTISCYFIYLIAIRIFNKKVGIISLFISSFYGIFYYFSNELLIITLFIFLLLLAFYFLIRAMDQKKITLYFLSGLIFGLSIITRPTILLFIIFVPLWLLLKFKNEIKFKNIIIYIALFTIGCIIPVLPVTIHNYIEENDFVLISSQGGVNFFIGNNHKANGVFVFVENVRRDWAGFNEDHTKIARDALKKPDAKPSEISDYWFNKGLDFIKKSPGKFIKLTFQKLYYFWNAYEVGNNRVIHFLTDESVIFKYLSIKFWFICPFAIGGIFLAFKRKKEIGLMLLFIGIYSVSVIMFFVNSRFRLPVVPFLIIFASYSFYLIIEYYHDNKKLKGLFRMREMQVLFLIIIFITIFIRPYKAFQKEDVVGHMNKGQIFLKNKDYENAIKEYETAKKLKPDDARPYTVLGRLYMEAYGDLDKSLFNLERALKLTNNNHLILTDMGGAYFYAKKYNDAAKYYKKALNKAKNTKDYIPIHYKLANAYSNSENYDNAISIYNKIIRIAPSEYRAYAKLGEIYLIINQKDYARTYINQSISINPGYKFANDLMKKLR